MKHVLFLLSLFGLSAVVTLLNCITRDNMTGYGLGTLILSFIGYAKITIMIDNAIFNSGKRNDE